MECSRLIKKRKCRQHVGTEIRGTSKKVLKMQFDTRHRDQAIKQEPPLLLITLYLEQNVKQNVKFDLIRRKKLVLSMTLQLQRGTANLWYYPLCI